VAGGNNYERIIDTRHKINGGFKYWGGHEGYSNNTSMSDYGGPTTDHHYEWKRIVKSNGNDELTKVVAIVFGNCGVHGFIYNQTTQPYRSEFGAYDYHPNALQNFGAFWNEPGTGGWIPLNHGTWDPSSTPPGHS
jgi:hypothetical protein